MTQHVKLEIGGEFHLHHHYHHSSPQPGAADIINSVREAKETIVTQLSEALAQLAADDQQLTSEVDELIKKLAQVPAEIQAAVQAALDQAGVDQTTAAQAAGVIDQQVKASLARVMNALNPAPGDTTTTAGDGSATATTAPPGSATADANAGGGDTSTAPSTDPHVQTPTTTSVDVSDSLVTDAGVSGTVSGGGAPDDVTATAPDPDPSGTGPGRANISGTGQFATETVLGGQADDSIAPGEPIQQV